MYFKFTDPYSQVATTLTEEVLNNGKVAFQFIKAIGDLILDDKEPILLTYEWD